MYSYFRHFHLHPLFNRNNQSRTYKECNKRFSLWIEDALIHGTSQPRIEPKTSMCLSTFSVFISSAAAIPTLPSNVRSHASSGVCTEASLCPSRVSKLNSGGVATWSSSAEFGCADVVCVLHDGEGYRTNFRMLWWICDPWPPPRPPLTHITYCRQPFLSPSSSFSFLHTPQLCQFLPAFLYVVKCPWTLWPVNRLLLFIFFPWSNDDNITLVIASL